MNIRKSKLTQNLIIVMTLIMLFINGTTMVLVKNIMEQTMINTEYKYLEKTANTIRDTTEIIVFEFISICDTLAINEDFIQILKDSDKKNPMAEHEKAYSVTSLMTNLMISYDGQIMSMAIFDIEQDSYLLDSGIASGDDFSFKERPYYEPIYTKTYVVTEPYLDVLTNGLVVTIASPIFDENNEVLGVVGMDLPIDFVSTLVLDNAYGDSGRNLVLSPNSKIIAYSDTSYINEDYGVLNITGDTFEHELMSPTGTLFEYEIFGEKRLGMATKLDSLNWTILTGMDYSEFDQISTIIIVLMLISVIFTLFICTALISGKLTKELIALNSTDKLTGLQNRLGFSEKVSNIKENPPKTIGIVSVTVNGLKSLNEKGGITAGDKHIVKSVDILSNHFGYEFFRMSGSELTGIAENIDIEEFESKIKQLHKAMKVTENYDFTVGHSSATKGYNIWGLIKESESVMHINRQEYYSVKHKNLGGVDNEVLDSLLRHLANEEFMVYLQPQVHLKDSSLYGAEALIRRIDKTNDKMIPPDEFITLYENNSVIRHIDLFVVEIICSLLQQLVSQNKAMPISVNLSRVTLQEYGIVETIVALCDKYKVPYKYLVIEVTERVGLVENNVASGLIQQFKNYGFHISLDDFGCAYSNIITLAQIEVDEIKIDKSLLDNVVTSEKNKVLLQNVLTMCNQLEDTVTLAEGIESEEQAKLLEKMGCVLGQGYYYSRPMCIADFLDKYIN